MSGRKRFLTEIGCDRDEKQTRVKEPAVKLFVTQGHQGIHAHRLPRRQIPGEGPHA